MEVKTRKRSITNAQEDISSKIQRKTKVIDFKTYTPQTCYSFRQTKANTGSSNICVFPIFERQTQRTRSSKEIEKLNTFQIEEPHCDKHIDSSDLEDKLSNDEPVKTHVTNITSETVDSSQNRAAVTTEIDTDKQEPNDNLPLKWSQMRAENLNCDYCIFYQRKEANDLMAVLEDSLEYNTGDLAKIRVFGKWHDTPRKQV